VRRDVEEDVQVARAAAVRARVAFAGERHLHSVRDADRDRDRHRTLGANPPASRAIFARRLDGLSGAGALVARRHGLHHAEERYVLHAADLTGPATLGTGFRFRARFRAVPFARPARLDARKGDGLFAAAIRVVERDLEVVAHVTATLGTAGPPVPAALIHKQVKNIAESAERVAAGPAGTTRNAFRAVPVVSRPLVRVGEHIVGGLHLFELRFRARLMVDIRVILTGKFAIRLFQRIGVGVPLDA
jgi:hypothetical protein